MKLELLASAHAVLLMRCFGGSPHLTNITWKTSHRHTQRLVSQVTINPIDGGKAIITYEMAFSS